MHIFPFFLFFLLLRVCPALANGGGGALGQRVFLPFARFEKNVGCGKLGVGLDSRLGSPRGKVLLQSAKRDEKGLRSSFPSRC